MHTRKYKLMEMGQLPEPGLLSKGGNSKRVIWLLELEKALCHMMELGNRSAALSTEAFVKSSIDLVIGMSPADDKTVRGRL